MNPQGTAASWGDRRQADVPEAVNGQAARLPILIEAAKAFGAVSRMTRSAPNLERPSQSFGEEALNLLFEKHRLNRIA
jgi:hypothetical protein